ncbi:unnamed protein product [Ectocarpus sp. 8 AP-2014]
MCEIPRLGGGVPKWYQLQTPPGTSRAADKNRHVPPSSHSTATPLTSTDHGLKRRACIQRYDGKIGAAFSTCGANVVTYLCLRRGASNAMSRYRIVRRSLNNARRARASNHRHLSASQHKPALRRGMGCNSRGCGEGVRAVGFLSGARDHERTSSLCCRGLFSSPDTSVRS